MKSKLFAAALAALSLAPKLHAEPRQVKAESWSKPIPHAERKRRTVKVKMQKASRKANRGTR